LHRDAHDDVAVERVRLGEGELRDRPDHLALGLRARLEADVRTREAEGVELLGIDAREGTRRPHLSEVARRAGGRLGGVVPAGEGHDENGPAEAGGIFVDGQGVRHVVSARWGVVMDFASEAWVPQGEKRAEVSAGTVAARTPTRYHSGRSLTLVPTGGCDHARSS